MKQGMRFITLTLPFTLSMSVYCQENSTPPAKASPQKGILARLWDYTEHSPVVTLATAGVTLLGATLWGASHDQQKTVFTGLAALTLASTSWLTSAALENRAQEKIRATEWDWEQLDKNRALDAERIAQNFPEDFDFGSGTSHEQVDGHDDLDNNTSTYSKKSQEHYLDTIKARKELTCSDYDAAHCPKACPLNALCASCQQHTGDPCPTICTYHKLKARVPAGKACDHWRKYKEDIKLMAEKGFTAYRFSIDWARIQPQEGVWHQEAITHYKEVCKELIRNNIRPIIGFHHYTDPQWFMDKGGFENRENLEYFAQYCKKTFIALSTACQTAIDKRAKVAPERKDEFTRRLTPKFLTFNSPSGYAANGYLQADRPPYVKNMQRCAQVLANMLDAHVLAYKRIKEAAQQREVPSSIGITKNIFQLDPKRWWNPIDHLGAFFGTQLVNESIYQFFRTGVFKVWLPGMVRIYQYNEEAAKERTLDFIGLNYYSHAEMDCFKPKPQEVEDSLKTCNPRYTIYGQGLYRALKELDENIAKPLNIPIIITETGSGVGDDIQKRVQFFKQYLYAASKACRAGINLQGIMIWSFMDTCEWGQYRSKYGLFRVNFDSPNLERIWRPAATFYTNVIKAHKENRDRLLMG